MQYEISLNIFDANARGKKNIYAAKLESYENFFGECLKVKIVFVHNLVSLISSSTL